MRYPYARSSAQAPPFLEGPRECMLICVGVNNWSGDGWSYKAYLALTASLQTVNSDSPPQP